jgi:DNA-binding transcriptional LysR family regulator
MCPVPSENSRMVMRSLGLVQQVLVASRAFLDRQGRPASALDASRQTTVCYGSMQGPHMWKLIDPQDQELQLRLEPALIVDDLMQARQAVLQGLGIAQLPLACCVDDIRQGVLEVLLPDHSAPLHEIQVLFPSRRGMLPAVRSFIDFLSAHCRSEVEGWQIKRPVGAGQRENLRLLSSRPAVKPLPLQSQGSSGAALDCEASAA